MLFRNNIIWEKRGHNGHDALRGFCLAEVNTLKPPKDSRENKAHNPIIELMLLHIYLFSISKILGDLQNKNVPLICSYIMLVLTAHPETLELNCKSCSEPTKALHMFFFVSFFLSSFCICVNKWGHRKRESSLYVVKKWVPFNTLLFPLWISLQFS